MPSVVRSPKLLGEALRRARRAAGLTQTELGQRTNLRQATISSLENGEGATLDTVFAVLPVNGGAKSGQRGGVKAGELRRALTI